MDFFKFFKKGSNQANSAVNNISSYSHEFANEISKFMTSQSSYSNNGVTATETTANNVKLTYNGLLAKSGASQVYAAIGYGSNNNWENVEHYPMNKTMTNTFEANIPIKKTGNLNVCFKDSANNWDNNSGMNYTFTSSIEIKKGSQ